METFDQKYREEHPFTINDGIDVTLQEVKKNNDLWAVTRQPLYTENGIKLIKSYFFGTRRVLTELAKEGAVGLRVYYGFDPEKKVDRLYLVAATADWKDIPENKMGHPVTSTKPCPDYCP